MRIVHTPVRFHPFVGGVEKYVLELGNAQAAIGHDVTVVCADEASSDKSSAVSRVSVIRLPYITKVANTNITPKLLPTLLNQDLDIIHTHIPTPWSADLSALVSLVRRKPLFVTYHNDLIKGGGIEKLIAQIYNITLLRLLFRRASKIIITQPRYLQYSKHLQKYSEKVVTIPLGVSSPSNTTHVKKKRHQLFFLSVLDRHHEYKGLDFLMKAVAESREKYPDIQLIVGGKGELVETYRHKAEELGIAEHITFLGFVSDEDLPTYFASSTAFVLPSVNSLEGFGIVALEALSYGTPVITTDLAGSAEYINKYNAGIVIKPKNVKTIISAIDVLFSDAKQAAKMGANGKSAVLSEFSWDKIATQFDKLYAESKGKS